MPIIKTLRKKLKKARAKHAGMDVPSLTQYQKMLDREAREHALSLKAKERAEKRKFQKWKIEQKYRKKRQQVKKGKSALSGVVDLIYTVGGPPPMTTTTTPKRRTRRRTSRKRTPRKKRRSTTQKTRKDPMEIERWDVI